jgi:protein-S-isoprenylcysteine O-methyltransferase Ste14
MTPLAFTLPYAFAFWVVLTWVFVAEYSLTSRTRPTVARPSSDRRSLPLSLFGLGAANLAALPLAFAEIGQFPLPLRVGLLVAGLGLAITGSLLRRHCWRVLGRHFTSAVTVEPGQPVIERGAYGWVRHPSYSGGMLMHVGYGPAVGRPRCWSSGCAWLCSDTASPSRSDEDLGVSDTLMDLKILAAPHKRERDS